MRGVIRRRRHERDTQTHGRKLLGTAYTVKYAPPYIQNSHGSIVGVSSVAGFHGLRTYRLLRIEIRHARSIGDHTHRESEKGVHVMIAAPGFTASNVRFSALTADGSPQVSLSPSGRQNDDGRRGGAPYYKRSSTTQTRSSNGLQRQSHQIHKKFCPSLLDILFYNHMAKEPDSPV